MVNNNYDMTRPASAWANRSAAPPVHPSSEPSRLTSLSNPPPQPDKRRRAAPSAPPIARQPSPVVRVTQPAIAIPRPAVRKASRSLTIGLPKLRTAGRLTQNLALGGVAFVAAVISVAAVVALANPRPFADPAGSPEAAPALRAALAARTLPTVSEDSPASGAGLPALAVPVEPTSLGLIRIPAIDVDAQYYPGVHDEAIALGPGLWPGTPLPGSAGNSVLSGHRTTHTHPFEDLDLLKEGDLIETNNGTDAGTQFQVVSIETVAESEYVDYVLAAPESPESVSLTLFACTPKGSKSHRIVVRAAAVAPIDGRGGA